MSGSAASGLEADMYPQTSTYPAPFSLTTATECGAASDRPADLHAASELPTDMLSLDPSALSAVVRLIASPVSLPVSFSVSLPVALLSTPLPACGDLSAQMSGCLLVPSGTNGPICSGDPAVISTLLSQQRDVGCGKSSIVEHELYAKCDTGVPLTLTELRKDPKLLEFVSVTFQLLLFHRSCTSARIRCHDSLSQCARSLPKHSRKRIGSELDLLADMSMHADNLLLRHIGSMLPDCMESLSRAGVYIATLGVLSRNEDDQHEVPQTYEESELYDEFHVYEEFHDDCDAPNHFDGSEDEAGW
jgi:hypothetical protein